MPISEEHLNMNNGRFGLPKPSPAEGIPIGRLENFKDFDQQMATDPMICRHSPNTIR